MPPYGAFLLWYDRKTALGFALFIVYSCESGQDSLGRSFLLLNVDFDGKFNDARSSPFQIRAAVSVSLPGIFRVKTSP